MTTTALPADISTQLVGLRDIHLPADVPWWPLAAGWWILAILMLVAALVAMYVQQQRRRSLKRAAIQELHGIVARHEQDDNVYSLAAEVGVLVRRIALELPGGKSYTNVYGETWIDYLAALPSGMKKPIAQLLSIAPYAAPTALPTTIGGQNSSDDNVSKSAIVNEAETWIRRHA